MARDLDKLCFIRSTELVTPTASEKRNSDDTNWLVFVAKESGAHERCWHPGWIIAWLDKRCAQSKDEVMKGSHANFDRLSDIRTGKG